MQPAFRVCVSQILALKVIRLRHNHGRPPLVLRKRLLRQMVVSHRHNVSWPRVRGLALGCRTIGRKLPHADESTKIGFHYCLFYRIFIIFWWLLPRRSPLRPLGCLPSRWPGCEGASLRVEEEKRKEKEGRGDSHACGRPKTERSQRAKGKSAIVGFEDR